MFDYWKTTPLEVQTTHVTLRVNRLSFNDLENLEAKKYGFYVPFLGLCVLELFHIAYLFGVDLDIAEFAKIEGTITTNMEAIFKLATLRVYRKEIAQIFEVMSTSFWPSLAFGKEFEYHNTKFLKFINMISHFNTVFAYSAMVVLLSLPLIQGFREFPMKLYFPLVNIHSYPYFEMITIFEWIVNYWAVLTGVMSYDYIFVSFGLNLINQMRMLRAALKSIGRFENARILDYLKTYIVSQNKSVSADSDFICEDDLLVLLEICVKHHQILLDFLGRIQNAYSYAFLAQCIGTFQALCFSGYILASQKVEDFTTTMFMISYILIHLVEMLILMGLAHLIYTQSLLVADAAFECGWYLRTFPKLRRHLVLVIHRAQKTQKLNAAGLITYDLEGYFAMCKWSFSFITLLQNVDSSKNAQ